VAITVPPDLLEAIDVLIVYMEYVQDIESLVRLQTRANLLAALRSMLFWFPNQLLSIVHASPHVMLLMAHLHAVALLLEAVQDKESALFRRLNVAPIQAFHEEIELRAALEVGPSETQGQYGQALDLMDFPLNVIAAFERRPLRFDCSGPQQLRAGELKSGIGWVNYDGRLSTLKILENFPVGPWHHSIS
jgi:hypothetical protein